jgi:Secretion system C-terminal sorting domain
MELHSTPLFYNQHYSKFYIFFTLLLTLFISPIPQVGYSQGCGVWDTVGIVGFSAGGAEFTNIAINSSGTPYVAYSDLANNKKASVMKYNGSAWVQVGNAGFSAGPASCISFVINNNGTPYIAYVDTFNGSYVASVKKYNGSNWIQVGNLGFTTGDLTSLSIDNSGIPYVAYVNAFNNGKVSVMKYNGSNWVQFGNAGFSAGSAGYISTAIATDGTLYVAYTDYAYNQKATVMKYNGGVWVQVGTAGFTAGQSDWVSLAIDGSNTPYIVYSDVVNNHKASVMKYNAGAWMQVGTVGFTPNQAIKTSIAIDGSGTPYIAYCDIANNAHASVMKYNGSNWIQVGNAGFTPDYAGNPSLAINPINNMPYVSYQTGGNYGSVAVQKFNTTILPTVAITINPNDTICAGTAVTYTATNTYGGTVPSYQWKKNGINVGTNSSVYTYTPNNGDSVRCIMTSSDVCVSQTTANSNSIVETVNPLLIPTITISVPTVATLGSSVTATATITNAGSNYTIYWMNRGVIFATTNFPPASGNSTTFTKGAGTDSITAKVVATGGGCYDSVTSAINTVYTAPSAIDNMSNANDVEVYPNPAHSILHLDNLTTCVDYHLQNLVGKTLLQGTFTQEKNTLQIQELPSGIYLLQLTDATGQRDVVRIIKE